MARRDPRNTFGAFCCLVLGFGLGLMLVAVASLCGAIAWCVVVMCWRLVTGMLL